MPRIEIILDDLKEIALAEIRSRRGCEGVMDILIRPVEVGRTKINLSISITNFGNAERTPAQLAVMAVQRDMEKRYRLLGSTGRIGHRNA